MGNEEKKKSRVQKRRDIEVPVEQPTSVQVNDGGDYMAYRNNGGVAPENNLPKPKATPMGVGGDGRYANTDVNTGTAALNNLFGDSWALTPEQEQARLRRMHTSSMIGNLGNVMSAFANLYYAGKGAPSQKVPDAVVPDYMSFVDRVNQARRNAEAMQMQRDRLAADAEYKQEQIRLKEKAEERQQAYYDAKIDKMIKEGNLTDLRAEKERIDIEMRIEENPLKLDKLRKEAQRIQATIDNITARTNKTNLEAGGKTVETTDDGDGNKTVVTTYGSGGASQQGGKGKGYGTRNNGDKGRGY